MFCPNCGTKLEGGEAFCTNCGERLEIEDRTVSPKKKSGGHKGKQTKIIVGTVAGVLAVAAAAGAALYFTGNKTTDIDLKPFFTIIVEGYEGDGHVELKFDA